MKVLVPVKRVPDYQVKVKVKGDASGIETDNIKWIVNPFDEIAVEEALRKKEAGQITEIVVVTVGPADASKQLRYAMAMGADRAIHVIYDGVIDSDLAARTLAEVYKKESPSVVIMGKQSIDSDASQTPQLLAYYLNLPQASFASKITFDGSNAEVVREVDGGLETMKVPLPAIISTDLRLNEPRYASLPNIMKANKKPLEEIQIDALGIDTKSKIKIHKVATPPKRSGGKKVGSVADLVSALRNEAKVI